MPSLLQSVARHVGRPLSKICTPFSMLLQMWFFEAASASASWSVQRKGVDGLSRCLNGDMAAVMEKA